MGKQSLALHFTTSSCLIEICAHLVHLRKAEMLPISRISAQSNTRQTEILPFFGLGAKHQGMSGIKSLKQQPAFMHSIAEIPG